MDKIPIHPSLQDSTDDSSIRSAQTESSGSRSPERCSSQAVALAKHELIASLMCEVYAMFNAEWAANAKQGTNSGTANDANSVRKSSSDKMADQKPSKRRREDEESPSRNDSDRKRKGNAPFSQGHHGQCNLFACPFNKYDPRRYRISQTTGTRYRTCPGPGFATIARLK